MGIRCEPKAAYRRSDRQSGAEHQSYEPSYEESEIVEQFLETAVHSADYQHGLAGTDFIEMVFPGIHSLFLPLQAIGIAVVITLDYR